MIIDMPCFDRWYISLLLQEMRHFLETYTFPEENSMKTIVSNVIELLNWIRFTVKAGPEHLYSILAHNCISVMTEGGRLEPDDHSLSSIPWPQGSLGHRRWFRNQFPPFFSVFHCPLGLGKLQACPFPDVVFPPLALSALSSSPFHCALQDGFGMTWWTGDMGIALQFASLYDGEEVFVWSDCVLDLGTDFLIGNMVLV